MQVIVVDHSLPVSKHGVTQNSVAINARNPDRVILYRNGWKEIVEAEIRQAIAFHEVLGLSKIEETGVYSTTQTVLAALYRAQAERNRLRNNAVYVTKFPFLLRVDDREKRLTEMSVRAEVVVRVVNRSNRSGVELVAIVDDQGQYGWTRLDNLRVANGATVVSSYRLRECRQKLKFTYGELQRLMKK